VKFFLYGQNENSPVLIDTFDSSIERILNLEFSHTGSEIIGQLCRDSPKSLEPTDIVKWVLSVTIPFQIFFNRIPRKSPAFWECKFGTKIVQINHDRKKNKFMVTIDDGLKVEFNLTFESIFRGPGKPFLVETKLKGNISPVLLLKPMLSYGRQNLKFRMETLFGKTRFFDKKNRQI
jgi:hypothetical protein